MFQGLSAAQVAIFPKIVGLDSTIRRSVVVYSVWAAGLVPRQVFDSRGFACPCIQSICDSAQLFNAIAAKIGAPGKVLTLPLVG